MESISASQEITNIFEAILDSDRLSLIAHLSQEELSLPELADQSGMQLKAVQRHLAVLENAQLVNVRNQDGKQVYRFNPQHLVEIRRQQFKRPKHNINFGTTGLPKDQQKILVDYTNQDGSLKMIPTKSKKIVAILDYLSTSFEEDFEYSERQINDILENYYPDASTLRRYLVDYGYLARSSNGSRYWRVESQDSETGIS